MVLDLIVIGILLVSAAVAFLRGFVREVLTIGALLGAAAATFLFGPALNPTVSGWIIDPAQPDRQFMGMVPYEMLVPVISFAIVFGVVLIGLTIAAHLVSKGVHSVGLGPVDRSLGVAFGLLRAVILIGLMGIVLNFVFSEKQRTDLFGDSKTYVYVSYTADLMNALLPDRDIVDKIRHKKDAAAADVGRQPLEPGQAGRARAGGGAGYTDAQRQNLDALVEQPQKPRKRFND